MGARVHAARSAAAAPLICQTFNVHAGDMQAPALWRCLHACGLAPVLRRLQRWRLCCCGLQLDCMLPPRCLILNMHAGTCSRRLCNALRRLRLCCFGMQPSCSPSPCGLNLNVHTGACTRLYCAFCKLTQHEMFLTLHCYCRLCIAIALITLFTGYHIVSHHAGVCGLHRAVFVTCKRICLTQFHNAMLTIVQVIV